MTTRRHPRTLHEAFPYGTDYACAVERPRKSVTEQIADVAAAVVLGVIGAALLLHWMVAP